MGNGSRTPLWVWALIGALAVIPPLQHAWLAWAPPAGSVPTGLHTGDSHVYLNAMRALNTGFYSPYASCHADSHDWRYYAVPAHVLYAGLGWVTARCGLGTFAALGILNGLGGFFYLWAAWRFLSVAVPAWAGRAFLLFALGGGLGGPLYALAAVMGLRGRPGFESVFTRYAAYDLIEGAHLWPSLHLPRLYYTAALGCGLLALAALLRHDRNGAETGGRGGGTLAGGAALLFVAQLVNMRVGTFVFGVACCYLMAGSRASLGRRLRVAFVYAAPVLLGGLATVLLMRQHPGYSANVVSTTRETIWLSALLSAGVFHLSLALPAVLRQTSRLPALARHVAFATLGYLAAFVALWTAYQTYYGNLWRIADTVVAVRVSDWALLGVPLGLAAGILLPRRRTPGEPERRESARARSTSAAGHGWVVLWLLLFTAAGVSAWGGGWYMQLVPRRLLVLLGLPLAILAAATLNRIAARRPRVANRLTAGVAVLGACSVAVGALYFQGPLGHTPGEGPFAYLHYEVMTPADAALLDALPPGRVAAPMFNPFAFTEVIALRPGNPVACGVGTLNHADVPFEPMREATRSFFLPETPDAFRREFVRAWCVRYVYCPDTCPVPEQTLEVFRATPWLHEVAARGEGAVFKVALP